MRAQAGLQPIELSKLIQNAAFHDEITGRPSDREGDVFWCRLTDFGGEHQEVSEIFRIF